MIGFLTKRNKYHMAIASFALAVSAFSAITPSISAATAAYYQNSPLISDSIYLNARSMSVNQIQQFLVSKNSYLVNYSVTESSLTETLSYYPNYNKSVLVSQAIYDAAQVYGINPQVILATMQKEQSLITDPAPSSSQLRFAMGYGCPDSSGCNNAAAGLFYQIDNGTWDLRYLFERARGNNTWWNTGGYPCSGSNTTYYSPGLYPGNVVSFFDDYNAPSANPRTAYSTFKIDNPATAAMYCYTPHAYPGSSRQYFSGSYNFVVAFTNWFGSATSGIGLFRSVSDPTVYAVYGGQKQGIPSTDVLNAWGLGVLPITTISDASLAAIPDRGILTRLAKNPYNNSIFLLADQGGTFDTLGSVANDWGFSTSTASTIGPELISFTQRLGSLSIFTTSSSGSGVYIVDSGALHLFSSPENLQSWAGSAPIVSVSSSLFSLLTPSSGIFTNQIQSGSNQYVITSGALLSLNGSIGSLYPRNSVTTVSPTLESILPKGGSASRFVKGASTGTIYLLDNGTRHGIASLSLLASFGGTSSYPPVTTLSDYEIAQIPNSQIISSRYVYDASDITKQYYVNAGIYALNQNFAANTYGLSLSTIGLSLLGTIKGQASCPQGLVNAVGTPGIYLLDSGFKRGIGSLDMLGALNNSTGNICVFNPEDINIIPTGPPISPFVSNSGVNYLLDQNKSYSISSSITSAIGSPSFVPVTSQFLSNYSLAGALTSKFQVNGQYVFIDSGKYYITPSTAIAKLWGINTPLQTHSQFILNLLSSGGQLTQFARPANSASFGIYIVDNEKFLPIGSLDHLFNAGYSGQNIPAISSTLINSSLGPVWQGYLAADQSLGTNYVLEGGRKHLIRPSLTTTWLGDGTTITPTTVSSNFLSLFPTGVEATKSITTGAPGIYGMNDGKKAGIPNLKTYTTLYYPAMIVTPQLINSVPYGPPIQPQ